MNKPQRQYDIFMLAVRESIYSEHGLNAALSQIRTANGGVPTGIGYTAAMAVKSVKGGIEQQGKKVKPEIVQAAYMETVADLTELAISAGMVEKNQKKQVATEAAKAGVKFFRQGNQGIVNQQMGGMQ